jgi:hypothetical protein
VDSDFDHLRGEVIDRKLRLDAIIGTGEKCVLFCGTHLLLNRMVAIKVFASQDAEFVAQGSKQNLRESQHMQKMLTTGTSEDIGYAVFDLNDRLSAADMARAYGLSSLSADYVQVLDRAARKRRREQQLKVAACGVCLTACLLIGFICNAWQKQQTVENERARSKQVLRFATRLHTKGLMSSEDLAELEQIKAAAQAFSGSTVGDERNAYREIADKALVYANNARVVNPEAAHDAFMASLRIFCVPGCAEPEELHKRTVDMLTVIGDARKPEWLDDALGIYAENYPYGLSTGEKALMTCYSARQLSKCGRAGQARPMFDENLAAASPLDASCISAAAINASNCGDERRAEQLVSQAVRFAESADPKREFRVLRQIFSDFNDMGGFDQEALIVGNRIYPTAAADPQYAMDAWLRCKANSTDRDWEMMILAMRIAEVYEREDKLADALQFYKNAQSWIRPEWRRQAAWTQELKKPQIGVLRVQQKLGQLIKT